MKLDALSQYLRQFTTASKKSRTTIYLDLFAGSADNVRRDLPDHHFAGSTVRAIETAPAFTHLRFFELRDNVLDLQRELRRRYPTDGRWNITPGDCNATLGKVLDDLRREHLHRSPTFAFIDPDGLDVDWASLARLAAFKHPDCRTKVEMWILFSHSSIPRLDGHDRALNTDLSHRVTALLGTDRWRRISQHRQQNAIAAQTARQLYIDFFCHRLEVELGYGATRTIDMGTENGTPIYSMVFATDHPAGIRIMESVLQRARERSAEFKQAQQVARARQQRERLGTLNLFDGIDAETPGDSDFFRFDVHQTSRRLPQWLTDE